MPVKKVFNSIEAARILGVNVSTVKRWTDSGKLDCMQTPGGHRKFLMKHFDAFLKAQPRHAGNVSMPLGIGTFAERTNHLIQSGDFEELQPILQHAALSADRDEIQLILNGLVLVQYPIYVIFDKLLTPVLHSLGDLWDQGKLSIMEEHVASQLIRDCVVELQDIAAVPVTSSNPALCLSFEDDQHDIAIKMVQVVLLSTGTSVISTGHRTPVGELERAIQRYKPGKIYISATFIEKQKEMAQKFESAVEICSRHKIPLFVGGQGMSHLKTEPNDGYQRLNTFEDVYHS